MRRQIRTNAAAATFDAVKRLDTNPAHVLARVPPQDEVTDSSDLPFRTIAVGKTPD
jgi:hypothetical protein